MSGNRLRGEDLHLHLCDQLVPNKRNVGPAVSAAY